MTFFIKELVKRKLNQLSFEELISLSTQYGFSLSTESARHIVAYVQKTPLDPFNKNDHMMMFQKLAEITDLETANKAKCLLNELIITYRLEHLLYE